MLPPATNITTSSSPNWIEFKQFLLQRMNERSAVDRLRYAKQFYDVLSNGDASRLLQLSADKRVHAMKALSNLAVCRML